jgi:hypothetical protein
VVNDFGASRNVGVHTITFTVTDVNNNTETATQSLHGR